MVIGRQQMMTSWQACEVLRRITRLLPSAPEGMQAAPDVVARLVCACPCYSKKHRSALDEYIASLVLGRTPTPVFCIPPVINVQHQRVHRRVLPRH